MISTMAERLGQLDKPHYHHFSVIAQPFVIID